MPLTTLVRGRTISTRSRCSRASSCSSPRRRSRRSSAPRRLTAARPAAAAMASRPSSATISARPLLEVTDRLEQSPALAARLAEIEMVELSSCRTWRCQRGGDRRGARAARGVLGQHGPDRRADAEPHRLCPILPLVSLGPGSGPAAELVVLGALDGHGDLGRNRDGSDCVDLRAECLRRRGIW